MGLFMGMWAFSNQQIFVDKVQPLETKYLYAGVDHHLTQFFYQLTPGTVLFIFFCFFSVFTILDRWIGNIKAHFLKTKGFYWVSNLHLVQNLFPYSQALKQSQVAKIMKEQLTATQRLGMVNELDTANIDHYAKVQATEDHHLEDPMKKLTHNCTYDML